MHNHSSTVRRGLVAMLLSFSFAVLADARATQADTTRQDDENTHGNDVAAGTPAVVPAPDRTTAASRRGQVLTAPPFAPLFATPADAHAYWDMLARSYTWRSPDPRSVAKSFIKERLGIDGDKYVVAHFATTQKRMEGSADNVVVLTDALMNAFPEHARYTFFGTLADAIGGLSTGGRQSPTVLGFLGGVFTCGNASQCFSRIGRFLWSRTGPGYIYNTFIGEGNVIGTLDEQSRPLDLAFGIYPKSSNFLPEHASPFHLSEIIDKFKEEGLFSELPYIRRLKAEFDRYWASARTEWPLLARYRFVHEARRALAREVLTPAHYELVMRGGAPHVPLHGSIALAQLRNTPPDASVRIKRLDINGYAATDILRFVAGDGSEVMYIPGAETPFVPFCTEGELREWVVRQARKRETLDDLLSHFSVYNRQDGTFWTGVAQGLAHLAAGRWTADGRAIDANDGLIQGDVFEDMREQVEARVRDDARMRTSTAWDAWRTTLNRTAAVLGPIGYVPPVSIPIQAGSALIGMATGIDQGINGKSARERRAALEQAVMTVVTNTALAATVGRPTAAEDVTVQPSPEFLPTTSPSTAPSTSTSIASIPPSPSTSVTTSESSTLTPTDSESLHLQGADARIAYSLGPVMPEWLSSLTEDQSVTPEGTHASRGANGPSPAQTDEVEPRRSFDLPGVDLRSPFNPTAARREMRRLGYLVQHVPRDVEEWTRRVIDVKKTEIDEARHRLDDFRMESLTTNLAGYQVSFDHSIVYRVDNRTPAELLRGEGFGPSSDFNDLSPMLRQRSTIGSGSIRGSNVVFVSWQRGFSLMARQPNFHQYAIWTERRPVASAIDNHDRRQYDAVLDEVHFPADVPPQDIFIVDSFDPVYAAALARIYDSPHVSTPYGVPLEAFVEYLAGRLDITAPNRFTQHRLSSRPSSAEESSSETRPLLESSQRASIP